MVDLRTLANQWILAKNAERAAAEHRRELEDRLLSIIGTVATLDGTENHEAYEYKIKIVGRVNKKIDSDLLQSIAIENGVGGMLSELFRWVPEINTKKWKATSRDITKLFEPAITSTPGRPSFTITRKED